MSRIEKLELERGNSTAGTTSLSSPSPTPKTNTPNTTSKESKESSKMIISTLAEKIEKERHRQDIESIADMEIVFTKYIESREHEKRRFSKNYEGDDREGIAFGNKERARGWLRKRTRTRRS